MKKLIYLGIVGIIAIGCSKENVKDRDQSLGQNLEKPSDGIYMLNSNDETASYQLIDFNAAELNEKSATFEKGNSNSAHTHGNYSGYGSGSFVFNGTQNNGGSHGSATFDQTVNVPFPPFEALVQITMETASVVLDGDEAIYGGVISESIGNPFPGGGPYAVGNYMYFKVKDNGQGNNADADQYVGAIFIIPFQLDDGGAGLPWFFGSLIDLEDDSEKIKVN